VTSPEDCGLSSTWADIERADAASIGMVATLEVAARSALEECKVATAT
jgi:hypothetical protein